MKIFKKILLLVVPFLLCACLEVKQNIIVNGDGGGKIVETVMMSKAMLKELNNIFAGLGEKGKKPEKIDIYDKAKLEADAAQYGPDVKYVSSKKLSTKTKEGYEVTYAFNDINKLKINQNPGDKGPKTSKDEKSDAKVENISFKFEKGDPATLVVNFPQQIKPSKEKKEKKDKTAKKDKEAEKKEMDEMREMFKDMYIGITIEPAGEIVATDATYRDGNRITLLEIDFSKLVQNAEEFEKFAKKEPETVEETKELLKNLPGFKVEMNRKVTVKFK